MVKKPSETIPMGQQIIQKLHLHHDISARRIVSIHSTSLISDVPGDEMHQLLLDQHRP